MRKTAVIVFALAIAIIAGFVTVSYEFGAGIPADAPVRQPEASPPAAGHPFPDFYRGLYLNNDNSYDIRRLESFITRAKSAHINTLVMDVQTSKYAKRVVPRENIERCLADGIHPVARVVVFPGGLSRHPAPESHLASIFDIAETACLNGFREIQFDYIRFSDEERHAGNLKHLGYAERYDYITGVLASARERLKKYNVRISADIFGRVPHRTDDRIGQKMERLDAVLDVIYPMAYPSHYWTTRMRNDPYGTVKWTSSAAKGRVANAAIVTYIQAFQMKMPRNMDYGTYVEKQIEAVHDAGVKGFILWNARQQYDIPLAAVQNHYSTLTAGRDRR